MWDVVWTDPDRLSRREHRERKASRPARTKTSCSSRSIFSRGSTSSAEGPLQFGLGGRRIVEESVRSLSPALSYTHTSVTAAEYDLESDRCSKSSVGDDLPRVIVARSPDSVTDRVLLPKQDAESTVAQIYLNDSRVSDEPARPQTPSSFWNTPAVEVALEPCRVVQTLSDGSFIVRSTEVTTTQITEDTSLGLSSEITTKANAEPKSPNRQRSASTNSKLSLRALGAKSLGRPPPLPLTPRRVPSSTGSLRLDNADGWKPPDAWACSPTLEAFVTMEETLEETSPPNSSFSMELNVMQGEVGRLASESNLVRLLRLKQVWLTMNKANSSKILELEKVQWMLSALYNMEFPVHFEERQSKSQKRSVEGPSKVLALYETPATASYLAAVYHYKQVYHLSSAPLSHALFPNIHPVLVPVRSTSAFPVAPSSFESVYSLHLPLSMPSQEIPGLLRNVHRCLKPGGALHLTLIDPLPIATSLGPRLRAWIEQHLLLNLETKFRCMSPSKLFPIWLENASLRLEHVTREPSRFFAVPRGESHFTPARIDSLSAEETKQELRRLVGRMLWIEVWGEYVVADKWWWEDPTIVEECSQWETCWQWQLIRAVKEQ
ncbi:hypothetical protein AK830_g2571 [Neonectria ditissima]|uniref:Methyltransferase type 11 domain-containing protein n=1 Tax=Neonectria ditissima TaxID=78410 RepID=A0A0P7BUR1_9HYPO|nr:hypothetical protein AK830_g2571 [Neonectria ditissima]